MVGNEITEGMMARFGRAHLYEVKWLGCFFGGSVGWSKGVLSEFSRTQAQSSLCGRGIGHVHGGALGAEAVRILGRV